VVPQLSAVAGTQPLPINPTPSPRFPIPVPQTVAMAQSRVGGANKPPSVSVNQIAQDASRVPRPLSGIPDLRGIPGIGQTAAGLQRLSNSPLNHAQIAQMNGLRVVGDRCVVWEGLLEWSIQVPGRPRTVPPNQQLSEMWVPVSEIM
jgi:hypothetical protein